ncbi:cytochrome P450 [Massariosphaeria phaeospora]|uniref:Cytochrome P450 n=1 Tax=Massariosphaeria phaeospora TaxID=100035 RepID=A0A7C8IFR8_9PLEO|nr:cytochrome P450 [Massariosphaeria phaeospora]
MPPWSWWFGHLAYLQRALKDLPPDVNVYEAIVELVREHSDTEIFLLDFWPVFEPVFMVYGPDLSMQVSSNQNNLAKPQYSHESLSPVVGGPSLISMNDTDWKFWRSLLNPGFSNAAMMHRVPDLVDAVETFCHELGKYVDRGVFSLDDMTTRLTMDVITKAILDTDLDNQRSEHPLAQALNTILAWHSFWDPRILLNPLRPLVQRYYGSIMDKFIRKELEKRFQEMKTSANSTGGNPSQRSKSVIALALNDYMAQKRQNHETGLQDLKIEDNFSRIAANQIRLFLFAGNDSTSSAIVYTFHLLSKYPETLAKLRQEHDAILGPPGGTAAKLKVNPSILNQCKYTLAVIKETLRLYPPASSMRAGRADVSITDRKGNTYPTAGLSITIMHKFVQQNPRTWPRPQEFLPERWLVEPGHELYVSPNNGAYRPFEQGPRSCIGQTLVNNEMRIVLILVARTFDFRPAYEEWDVLKREKEGVLMKMARALGVKGEDVKMVDGERAYQTSDAGAHPAERYPCRVSLAA